jgi:diguanylate cyclase (GGDEF)-like protein
MLAEARKRISELEAMVDLDPLVPVFNRRAFERELERTIAMCERYKLVASVAFVDLDDFKLVNDRFGHAAGDAALLHAGGLIAQTVRRTDVVGRLGGDEFGVIMPQTRHAGALRGAERLSEVVRENPLEFGGRTIHLTATVGATEIKPGDDVKSAIDRADQEMYRLK